MGNATIILAITLSILHTLHVTIEVHDAPHICVAVFTRGQFWPSGIVVACVCVCECLSVCQSVYLSRAQNKGIVCQSHAYPQNNSGPFNLGSPNLDQRCKRPWLTHRGRVTHLCVGNLTIIGSDNGLSPGRRQAII